MGMGGGGDSSSPAAKTKNVGSHSRNEIEKGMPRLEFETKLECEKNEIAK